MKIIQINQVVNIAYCFKRYLLGLLFLIGPLHVSAQEHKPLIEKSIQWPVRLYRDRKHP